MGNFIIRIAVLFITAIISFTLSAADRRWEEASGGLPYYRYEGSSDDAILLGNSRIKVRAHVNGIYELMSGDRCWGRYNADPLRPEYGKNRATVSIGRKDYELVGAGSLAASSDKCEVYSGAGFIRYDFELEKGIKCSRMISVMPSDDPQETADLFLVTLTFENQSKALKGISYEEAISPYYVQAEYQFVPESERPLHYNIGTDISFRCLKASFSPAPQGFATLKVPEHRSRNESAPHSIFLYSDNAFLVINEGELKASIDRFWLRPKKKHTFHIVIGFSGENNRARAEAAVLKAEDSRFGAFSSMWKKHLPDFSSERNKDVRNELYYSAYSIEASLLYSDYFKESFVIGSFRNASRAGENSSNSDHINAALQACYTNPSLAKSIIRYVMKQTSFDGMIPDGSQGFGYISSDRYTYNLIQLEVLNVLAEYLRLTGDYAFLDEWIEIYPLERGEMQSVKSIIESYFIYLSDRSFVSPSMSSMQAAILPRFADQMEKSGKLSAEFLSALKAYTDKSVEEFNSRTDHNLSDLPYLLDAGTLTDSHKRNLLDRATEAGAIDMRAVSGLVSFDVMEANSLFRDLILKNRDSKDPDIMDSWTIYSYFRIHE